MEKQKCPKVRFTGFDTNWYSLELKDFGQSSSGTAIESEFVPNGKYKVISIGSYSLNSTYTDQGLRVNFTHKIKDRILNLNDLTMVLNDKTLSGEIIGRALLIDQDDTYVFNQRTQRIILDQKIFDPRFLYQLLNADFVRRNIIKLAQGNTQIYVNWSTIKNLEYYIPSRKEQNIIGNFFQNLDQSIALHEKKLAQTQNLKKAMLEKMFPKVGSKQPEIRLKGFSGEWGETTLGAVVDIVGGGTPDTNVAEFWNGDIDWYSPTEIGENVYANGSLKKITASGLKNSSAKVLPAKKTVLFSSRAGIGEMAILNKSAATNQGFQSFITNNIDVYFLYSMGFKIKKFALSKASGSTFLEISRNQLAQMEFLIPSSEEQKEIGNFFKQLDETLVLQQQQLQTLKNLKQAFLEKMFV